MSRAVIRVFPKILIFTAIVTVALVTNYLFAAWSPAPPDPPNSNVATPLNVGSDGQVKQAGLTLQMLIVNGTLWIQDGSEGAAKVLTSDATGAASWQDPPPSGSGNVPTCADGEYLVYDNGAGDWICDPNQPQTRITGSCPAGQVIQSVNMDGTVTCENLPASSGPGCIHGNTTYSAGDRCTEGPGRSGESGSMMCSKEVWSYLKCNSDGTWSRDVMCYDPADPLPYPAC